MKTIKVERSETFFYNDFLKDYLESDKLQDLRSYSSSIDEVEKAINSRQEFSSEKRELLVNVLLEQYKKAKLEISGSLVKSNIKKLLSPDTYTITTGQQIHIGLGPLYVIYKILDILQLSELLNEKYVDYGFVPIFWMASEDHDLEEIQEVNLFGKYFKWETHQSGAVGRMHTTGISELFTRLEKEFRFNEAQHRFIKICKEAYSKQQNLSDAFREIVHTLFRQRGLVIIDADHQHLKNSFIPVLEDELAHNNAASLEKSTKLMEELGHQRQLLIRDCNLFKLSSSAREKVAGKSRQQVKLTAEEAYQLSPNAALRPFYQEWILPNILYVGGGAELRYWSQLKGLFDNYLYQVPILWLRSSYILMPEKYFELISQLEETVFFKSDLDIAKLLSDKSKEKSERLSTSFQSVLNAIDSYEQTVNQELSGFSLLGKIKKLMPKVTELNHLVQNQLANDLKSNSELSKVLKVKSKYFDSGQVQERTEHVLQHIDTLLELSETEKMGEQTFASPRLQLIFD